MKNYFTSEPSMGISNFHKRAFTLFMILALFVSSCSSQNDELTTDPVVTSKTTVTLPDTGQATSYTSTPGEDADFTINSPSLKDNGDGTVTDNVTGLIWQKTDGGEMTFENASTYCKTLLLIILIPKKMMNYLTLIISTKLIHL